jgi:hypothetical protein
MMPVLAVNKAALSLVAIFAVAVLAGCSSPSPESSPTTGPHLRGTMNDWVNAVCKSRGPLPMAHGRVMSGATNPMECPSTMQTANGGRMAAPILIGTYTSESVMENDLGQVGAYAEGNQGSQYVLFASVRTNSDKALAAESEMLQPLRAYGFQISPSPN